MARLWKKGTNLCYTALFSIGLFISCLLLLGWSPTRAALPGQDRQEAVIAASVDEIYGPARASVMAKDHVAQAENIPVDKLQIVNNHTRTYPNLGREFQAVVLLDTRSDGLFYHTMIDKATGKIINDISAIREAEAVAYHAQYGKLEKKLYERLQEIDDEILPVAIWVNGASPTDRQEIIQAVANQFPQARSFLEQGNIIWAVEDQALRKNIKQEYERLSIERAERRTAPLIDFIQHTFDVEVTTLGSMPSIIVYLRKHQIHTLVEHSQVDRIYLVGEEGKNEMDVVRHSIGIHSMPVWPENVDGVTIAILGQGIIDPDTSCLEIVEHEDFFGPIRERLHKTFVASIASCYDLNPLTDKPPGTYDGIARGAPVLDAGNIGSDIKIVESLEWATDPLRDASIVNFSTGFTLTNALTYTDRAFDYWARHRRIFIAKSAGNTGGKITSPGHAWNIVTVGGSNDMGTVAWNDDTMYADSAYINSAIGDREKPEVVAPAVNITSYGSRLNIYTDSGTSLAAPQVAGLAALLMNNNPALENRPEVVKAIIMASATNNIVGPSIITTTQGDLRDGAGAINAFHASDIAQIPCTESCWWHHDYNYAPTELPESGATIFTREFYAYSGQYIRAVISWWSNADGPGAPLGDYSTDFLLTDLNLSVEYNPNFSGNWEPIANSASWDNNYEMVGFPVRSEGLYRIRIMREFSREPDNSIGIALLQLPYMAGDINCDGQVDTTDSLFLLRAEIGLIAWNNGSTCASASPTSMLKAACDVSGDSVCNSIDALFILRCDVGHTNSLCPPNRDDYAIYIPDF